MDALSINGGAKIRDTWEALKDVLDEFNMIFNEEGIHINSLDVNDVALVNATFWKHAFQRYSCSKVFVCGLNMAVLYKTFKLVGKSTELTLRIDERYPSALYVCMENVANGLKVEVTLKIFQHTKSFLRINDSVFLDRYITMPSSDFQALVGFISNFQTSGDDDNKVLDIEVQSKALVLSSRGQFGLTRVSVQETNSGMNMTAGKVDALDDKLVAVDSAALAAEQEDLDEALGEAKAAKKSKKGASASGEAEVTLDVLGKRKRKRKTAAAADDDDEDSDAENSQKEEEEDEDEDEEDEPAKKKKRVKGAAVLPAAPPVPKETALALLPASAALAPAGGGGGDEVIVRNSYNLKYIRYFTKATPLSTMTRIFLRPNFPIILMYNIGTMGVLRYCLGPTAADEDAANEEDGADGEGGGCGGGGGGEPDD